MPMPQAIELPRLLEPEDLLARMAKAQQPDWGDVLILDLCQGPTYAAGHIHGAVHVEPTDLVALASVLGAEHHVIDPR